MSPLFRHEAVSHATRRLNGEVVLATPVSFRVIAALAVAVVFGAVLFVATASYARKETVVGWLTPDAGLIRLAARQGGVVEAVHVKEGDLVSVGQPVASLRLSSALESGDAYAALLLRYRDNHSFSCPRVTLCRRSGQREPGHGEWRSLKSECPHCGVSLSRPPSHFPTRWARQCRNVR